MHPRELINTGIYLAGDQIVRYEAINGQWNFYRLNDLYEGALKIIDNTVYCRRITDRGSMINVPVEPVPIGREFFTSNGFRLVREEHMIDPYWLNGERDDARIICFPEQDGTFANIRYREPNGRLNEVRVGVNSVHELQRALITARMEQMAKSMTIL